MQQPGKETWESRTLIVQEGASAACVRGRAGSRGRVQQVHWGTGSDKLGSTPPVAARLNNSSHLIYLSGSVTHKHTHSCTHTHKELQLSPLPPSSPTHTHIRTCTRTGTHASGVGGPGAASLESAKRET